MHVKTVRVFSIHLKVDVRMNVTLISAHSVFLKIIVLIVKMVTFLIMIDVLKELLFQDVRLSMLQITDYVRSVRLDGL